MSFLETSSSQFDVDPDDDLARLCLCRSLMSSNVRVPVESWDDSGEESRSESISNADGGGGGGEDAGAFTWRR